LIIKEARRFGTVEALLRLSTCISSLQFLSSAESFLIVGLGQLSCRVRTAFFWVITRRVVVISYRRFGTTLKMGPIVCPETPVRNYHYPPRNSPEERSSQLLRGGSLKSLKGPVTCFTQAYY